ncbi:MAG TPA: ATP-binding cassette domain-containing protein, partial [Gaiellaceae bacterium]|nr:ATP-binding cassette domain-containing protein [Gaiellaceae bacterium]
MDAFAGEPLDRTLDLVQRAAAHEQLLQRADLDRVEVGRAETPEQRGVDFAIEPGEVFGLLGPNGAGKTTTVEILEGYRSRDTGDVQVLG